MQEQFRIQIIEIDPFLFVFRNVAQSNTKGKASFIWNSTERVICVKNQDQSKCVFSEGCVSSNNFVVIYDVEEFHISVEIQTLLKVFKQIKYTNYDQKEMSYDFINKKLTFELQKKENQSKFETTIQIPIFYYNEIKSIEQEEKNYQIVVELFSQNWNNFIYQLTQKYKKQLIINCLFYTKNSDNIAKFSPELNEDRELDIYLKNTAVQKGNWMANQELEMKMKLGFLQIARDVTGMSFQTLVQVFDNSCLFVQHEFGDSFLWHLLGAEEEI